MKSFAALALVAISSVALAQSPIGPFTGTNQEGFESQPTFQFLPSYSIFDGQAAANALTSGQGLHVTNGWSFFSSVNARSGGWMMGGAGVNTEIVFNAPVVQFGGYFATNTDVAGAVVRLYDASNTQVGGNFAVGAPIGQWQWDGWQYAGGIKRVTITANNSFGGFIMMDDLEFSAVPEPATMAALGLGALAMMRRKREA